MFPKFDGFPPGQSQKQFLLDALRTVAKKHRKDKTQAFYSMRELALFFKTPLRTIALVYEVLEKEGLLSRIRGSQTLLTGKKNTLRFPVRGVVGIPIWLDMLVLSSFTRIVNMQLEEGLRQRGYVADLIFHYTKEDETQPEFAARLLQHQLDCVIWQNPSSRSYQNLLSLRDSGIRLLLIQTIDARLDLPAVTYVQDWNPAYHQFARHWKRLGINSVLMPFDPQQIAYRWEVEKFTEILRNQGLAVEPFDGDPSGLLEACNALESAGKIGLAFIDTEAVLQ